MQYHNHQLIYSPADLIQYHQSEFASWMDRLALAQPKALPAPATQDEFLTVLRQLGQAHENKFLQSLQSTGADVCMVHHQGGFEATLAAMKAGRNYIYQAALRGDGFLGYADFLIRVEEPSPLGSWSYVPLECKLALNPKPDFVLQACTYCDLLEAIQGKRPQEFRLLLGSGEIASYPTEQFFYYYKRVRQSFLQFMDGFNPDQPPIPEPGDDRHGRWQDYAEHILHDRDHLSLVANITGSQIRKLEAAGITTVEQLANLDQTQRITNLDPLALSRLVTQAQLQKATLKIGQVQYCLVQPQPDQPNQGLALLPPQSPLDVYFDMEGYPLAPGGLEYLFGAVCVEANPAASHADTCGAHPAEVTLQFYDWWAHNNFQEKQAFEGFIDWVYDRWQRDASMHIYHYAAYETIALKRLMGKYATREAQVDDLLRSGVFVDLYQIVRQSLRVGQPSYSIKKLEPLYHCQRSGEVQTANDSVLQYFYWTQSQDGHTPDDSKILQDIRDYNRTDCESTKYLVDWLRELQNQQQISYVNNQNQSLPKEAENPNDRGATAAELAESLLSQLSDEDDSEEACIQRLLAHLLQFHQREGKPFWWQRFSWLVADEADLYDELDCLAGLERTDRPPFKPSPRSRSLAYEYRFDPNQETKLESGTCWFAPEQALRNCKLESLGRETGIATISISEKRLKELEQSAPGWSPPQRTSLIDCNFIDSTILSQSVLQTVQQWANSKQLPPALQHFLQRQPPRIPGHILGQPLLRSDETLLQGTLRIATTLQSSTLCIQGPPGSGKTYTAAQVIVKLLALGKSIAICANSHKVITNLLARVAKLAEAEGLLLQGAKIGGDRTDEVFQAASIRFQEKVDTTLPPEYQLVGATAYQLSREAAIGQFDYLFIDEAGQLSLANLVAIARCADNLILMGDPMQLEQPTQGTHPGESGLSALNYFLNGRATIPHDLGIFLDTSYRMHPSICRFISDAVYEGRLKADRQTQSHQVEDWLLGQGVNPIIQPQRHGILFIPVEHEGNQQASEEEIQVIEQVINQLLGRSFVSDRGKRQHTLQPEDILVVAPYNLQVRKLQSRLRDRARIGTVDKFQGQEAPVLIVSMCASRGNLIPRGLEFLLNRHRLNVAISRAQCLSLVVGSPFLAQTMCSTLEEVKLVNLFCKLSVV
ncbi:TM0106 family RecB-like putative nuclease [Alkalinema sp. FACHB-956]|uniref:TM0106 family RecB-like putative nuclease n=1 Tax=Alkalinema sp. FACHB-956 TaxID=2692768 RepID=UPI0016884D3C|nr:TM0106 family RecB-like putative nuclease [Alkalinema sp. FACHB-956]MBD2329085.1 TM0106 family RecB-like putative nuclease [Alkalinema sp. FACHB-956]